jgi:RecG-like helicase
LVEPVREFEAIVGLQTRVETGIKALPFTMTAAQKRVLGEILEDMEAPVPMLRLLQGDVGSGKTAVIFLAALAAISSGHQVAILVPNDVLATQHDTFIRRVSKNMPEEHQPVVEVVAGRVTVRSLSTRCLKLLLCHQSTPSVTSEFEGFIGNTTPSS